MSMPEVGVLEFAGLDHGTLGPVGGMLCGWWFQSLSEAIAVNNEVKQGLSSSLFTGDLSNIFQWIGYCHVDSHISHRFVFPFNLLVCVMF